MFSLSVKTTKGIEQVNVWEVGDISLLPFDVLKKRHISSKKGKRGCKYFDIPCAFDIETTTIINPDRPYAFMHQWQFCIDEYVFFGRTWKEYQQLIKELTYSMGLSSSKRLVVYVHNLAFEWQFMYAFFDWDEYFFTDARQPLKVTSGGIEYRCSYKLSNMKLSKFCENTANVRFYKKVDTFDYRKMRTPETPLTPAEQDYCYCDVRGLCECIAEYLKEDTLATIPLTSTGYVRRDMRNSYQTNWKLRRNFVDTQLTPELYTAMRHAFRGGNTHANGNYYGQILTNVASYDISSSYPAVMINERFPSGKFFPITVKYWREHDLSDYALLMHIRILECEYVEKCGVPYIPTSKCIVLPKNSKDNVRYINDNGRIMYAEFLEMWVTDIDYEIIKRDYKWKQIYINEIYASRYERLPTEFRRVVMKYYSAKTQLKGVEGYEYEYLKSKNKVNSCYGFTVSRLDRYPWEFDALTGEYTQPEKTENENALAEVLERYYKSRSNFLPYQIGVWVTAHARKRLQDMLWTVGKDVIYCDTDSVKCIGDHAEEFAAKNAELMQQSEANSAWALDRKQNKKYLGVWDYEGSYAHFKTLGAKSYLYNVNAGVTEIGGKEVETVGEYHSTIAGVSKKRGQEYFTEHGFDGYKNGAIITHSGNSTAYYNPREGEETFIHKINVDNVEIETAGNVAIVDSDYTIGVTNEYLDLWDKAVDSQEPIV